MLSKLKVTVRNIKIHQLSFRDPLTSPTGSSYLSLVWPVAFVASRKEIGWCMLENDFSFRPVLTMTVFSENLHTGYYTASNVLYVWWGNTNCFLFQVRPGAGREVSPGLSLFALSQSTPHPGVSPLMLESWVPVPRTFACLVCMMGKPWERKLTTSKEE